MFFGFTSSQGILKDTPSMAGGLSINYMDPTIGSMLIMIIHYYPAILCINPYLPVNALLFPIMALGFICFLKSKLKLLRENLLGIDGDTGPISIMQLCIPGLWRSIDSFGLGHDQS